MITLTEVQQSVITGLTELLSRAKIKIMMRMSAVDKHLAIAEAVNRQWKQEPHPIVTARFDHAKNEFVVHHTYVGGHKGLDETRVPAVAIYESETIH